MSLVAQTSALKSANTRLGANTISPLDGGVSSLYIVTKVEEKKYILDKITFLGGTTQSCSHEALPSRHGPYAIEKDLQGGRPGKTLVEPLSC